MDIWNIYRQVETYVREKYGLNKWCYTDFFLDNKGFSYFKEEVERDTEITPDMDDEEIIEHICQSISESETMHMFQQSMKFY